MVAVAGWRASRFGTEAYDVALRSSAGAVRWRFRGAFGRPSGLTFDGAGHVVVGGTIAEGTVADAFAAVGLDRRRGTERWRFVLPAGGASVVAAASDGDVLVGGSTEGTFVVARLDSAGSPRWLRELPAGPPTALAVEALGGSAVVTGFGVVRFGPDGTQHWSVDLGEVVIGVALAADGDAVVSTVTGARRLAAADGAERWRVVLAEGRGSDVALDPAGDVILGADVNADVGKQFVVVKLDGASGAERWRSNVDGPGQDDTPVDVALDGDGDVAVGATLNLPGRGRRFVVFRLAGSTGRVRARRLVAGRARPGSVDDGRATSLDGRGRIVALGAVAPVPFGFGGPDQRGVLLRTSSR